MTYFIAALIAFVVFSGLLSRFLGTDPKWLSGAMRKGAGYGVIALGVFLLMRGQFELALALGVGGAVLLGWNGVGKLFPGAVGAADPMTHGLIIETMKDPATGRILARFVAGPYAGRDLDSFQVADLARLYTGLDPANARLVAMYLDSRDPGWGEHMQGNANGRPATTGSGTLTEKEAYEVLGLEPGASEEAIRQAHRALMKRLHPDQGGSTYLATRVNLAKDILLARHSRNS